jgi:hypothetical protein
LGIPDLRDLNLCLLAAWVQRYQVGGTSYGKLSWIRNIKLILLTFCVVRIGMAPPFGKGCAGQLRLPEWGSNGR